MRNPEKMTARKKIGCYVVTTWPQLMTTGFKYFVFKNIFNIYL